MTTSGEELWLESLAAIPYGNMGLLSMNDKPVSSSSTDSIAPPGGAQAFNNQNPGITSSASTGEPTHQTLFRAQLQLTRCGYQGLEVVK